MACTCAQDLLQKLDCLATEAGQARVQHKSDKRDDCIHVGPGEGQGRKGKKAGLSRLTLLTAILQHSPHMTATHSGPPTHTSVAQWGSPCGGRTRDAHTPWTGLSLVPWSAHPRPQRGFCAWLRKCRRAA